MKIYKVRKEARAEVEKLKSQGFQNAKVNQIRIETKAKRKIAYQISLD